MKITMVEYQGRHDEHGEAIGHAPKVLKDYARYIQEDFSVEVFAPDCIFESVGKSEVFERKTLKHAICMKSGKSVFLRLKEKIGMFQNISQALKQAEGDVIWFFNIEFYLMLYLALHKKQKKRVVCTLFQDHFPGGKVAKIKQSVFEKAQKKMDFIIATGPQLQFANCDSKFLPDYACDEKKYSKYRTEEKNGETVILGTMGVEKELEEAVQTYTSLNLPLTIAGRFHDKDRLSKLKALAGEKITFRDEYLSEEEYLALLGKSSYVLLPYSPKRYESQTSGVLQESIFVGTIPVAYEKVLSGNGVPGIGFSGWNTLSLDLLQKDQEVIYRGLENVRETVYGEESLRQNLREIFTSKE